MALKIEHKKKTADLGPGEVITNTNWDDTHNYTMLGTALLGRSAANEGNVMEISPANSRLLLGLDQVNNTSDADKPISDDQQIAFDGKVNTSAKATQADIRGKVVNKWLASDLIDAVHEGMSPYGIMPPPITNTYFGPPISGAVTTLALVANRAYFIPMFLSFRYQIDFLSLVTTTAGSNLTNMGVYDTDPITGWPTGVGTFIGAVSGSSTGIKKSTLVGSKTVGPGLVWLCLLPQTAQTVAASIAVPAIGFTVASAVLSPYSMFYGTSTYAVSSLPNFSAVTALTAATGAVPCILLGGP